MEKNNKSTNTIYDDSVSSGAILKDVKKKLGKRMISNGEYVDIPDKQVVLRQVCYHCLQEFRDPVV